MIKQLSDAIFINNTKWLHLRLKDFYNENSKLHNCLPIHLLISPFGKNHEIYTYWERNRIK